MRTRASALAVVALVLAACAGCGGGGAAYSKDDLPRLVLQRGDVPQPFRRFSWGRQAAADQFPGTQSDLGRFGREDGWKARYERRGATPATAGPLVIESRADVFESDDGARKDFRASAARFDDTVLESGGFATAIQPPALGDEVTGITFRQPSGTSEVRFFMIAWRDANITASITLNGFNGRVLPADVFALARKQARRIEAAR